MHHTLSPRLSTSGVRVTETDDIHKSLNPCNDIPHGQQRWRGEKMRIFSLQQNLLRPLLCPWTHRAVRWCKKPRKWLFFFFPRTHPLFWLHPSPLTNVLGSQGATVLLSGPFPFFHPWSASSCQGAPIPHRAYYGIECIWPFWEKKKKNNGWRPFVFLASYKELLQEICKQNDKPVHVSNAVVTVQCWIYNNRT